MSNMDEWVEVLKELAARVDDLEDRLMDAEIEIEALIEELEEACSES